MDDNNINEINRKFEELYNENIQLKEMLQSKDKLIEQFQEAIQISTIKIKELEKINSILTKKLQSGTKGMNSQAMLDCLSQIKEEVNQIEFNYENKIQMTNKQINQLEMEVNYLVQEKNNLMKQFDEYQKKNEIEKQNLTQALNKVRNQVKTFINKSNTLNKKN